MSADQDSGEAASDDDAKLLLQHFRRQLQLLSKELTCPICMDLIDKPHCLPCNHFFCQACIHEAFKHKSECPVCKQPTIPRAVQPFRLLANVVHWYRQNDAVFQCIGSPSSSKLVCTSSRAAKRARTSSSDETPASLSLLLDQVYVPPLPASIVVVGTGLDDEQASRLRDLCAYCNVESELTAASTHLVTNASGYPAPQAAKRTLKYLEGILRGVWVLSSDWVAHSLLAGRLLDESTYVVTANNKQPLAPGPKIVSRLRQQSRFEPLFAGRQFFVRQSEDGGFPSDELKKLVLIGGGKVVKTERRRAPAELWIVHDGSAAAPQPGDGCHLLSKEQFFEAIVSYAFPPADAVQSTSSQPSVPL